MRDYPKVFTIRLSEAQAEELKAKAKKDERSAGEIVRELIEGCLASAR